MRLAPRPRGDAFQRLICLKAMARRSWSMAMCLERWSESGSRNTERGGRHTMSIGLILIIILVIVLIGAISGHFGGYGYGYGHGAVGILGVILTVLFVLLLMGRL
jgi:Protein of unknown function (DUF3309)